MNMPPDLVLSSPGQRLNYLLSVRGDQGHLRRVRQHPVTIGILPPFQFPPSVPTSVEQGNIAGKPAIPLTVFAMSSAAGPGPDECRPSLRFAFGLSAGLVLLLWLIWAVDTVWDLGLLHYGVFPRDTGGLGGIFLGPLIHGSAAHLLANTPSLLVLCTTLLYAYPRSAPMVLPAIYLGSGLGVWLFARESFHIGASGLTHGLMFFIFVIGILRRDRPAIALSLMVFFLYGGMIWGILPQKPHISFESHFFGALVGLVSALLLRNRDPREPEKYYEWEDEPEDEAPVLDEDTDFSDRL